MSIFEELMDIKRRIKQSLLLLLFPAVLSLAHAQEANSVSIIVDAQSSNKPIPEDFIGLSYETKTLLPDENGKYYFSAGNASLVSVFKSLNVKSLRIGGNSVDVAKVPIPTEKDIDQLFAFARTAGLKVIYSVRLEDGDPASAARLAKYIYQNYDGMLDYFAIGNEPAYYKNYEQQMKPHWQPIMEAMRGAAPKARFCAPDDNPNPGLCQKLFSDFGGSRGPLSLVTIHSYPGDCAYKNPFTAPTVKDLVPYDAGEKREHILSSKMTAEYEKIYHKMEPVISTHPFRISETNNIWYGGLDGASNTYASALWGVDYMYWWATHRALGVNFHTGDKVGGGDKSVLSLYAAFVTQGNGFDIRPLSYAIKLFSIGCNGKTAPVQLSGNAENLTAYATKKENGELFITIINKSHGTAANRTLDISLADNAQIAGKAQYLFLEVRNGDVSARNGITIGGREIGPDGTWEGEWKPLKSGKRTVRTSIPAASAMIIKVKVKS